MIATLARSEYCSLKRRLKGAPGAGSFAPGLGEEFCLVPSSRGIQYRYPTDNVFYWRRTIKKKETGENRSIPTARWCWAII